MKLINYVTCLLAAGALVFSFLIWKQGSGSNLNEKTIIDAYLAAKKKEAAEVLAKIKIRSQVDKGDAIEYISAFDTNINKPNKGIFPSSVLIDEKFINVIANGQYNGVRIYPVQYTKNINVDGRTFNLGDISFMLVPTINGSLVEAIANKDLFDYGNPCRPIPCKEDDF